MFDATQLSFDFRGSPAALSERRWLAFTIDHNEEDASRAFQNRYGSPPTYIFESLHNLLVGPVPEDTP